MSEFTVKDYVESVGGKYEVKSNKVNIKVGDIPEASVDLGDDVVITLTERQLDLLIYGATSYVMNNYYKLKKEQKQINARK